MDIVKQNSFALPADFGDKLMSGIADTRASMTQTAGGQTLLRLLRNGQYVIGQNNEPVKEGSRGAVNLASLGRGWVCWGDGVLLGQVMDSVQAPRVAQPAPIQGVAFEEQFGFELTFVGGELDGETVAYKGNSYGFKKAFTKLIADIQAQWSTDKAYYWPIIELRQDSYPHKKYGQIFEPVLNVVAWANADGHIEGSFPAKAAAPEPEPVKAAPRQRKPAEPAPEPAPVSTQQAHVGQRRRPQSR